MVEIFYGGQDIKKNFAISFPAHWGVGRMPVVPPTSDLLATISMFEQQIKSEPMGFYTACQPPLPPQMASLPSRSVENSTGDSGGSNQQQPPQQQQQTVIKLYVCISNNLLSKYF